MLHIRVAAVPLSTSARNRPACRARSAAAISRSKLASAIRGSASSCRASNMVRYSPGWAKALAPYADARAITCSTGSSRSRTSASAAASRRNPSSRAADHSPGIPPNWV